MSIEFIFPPPVPCPSSLFSVSLPLELSLLFSVLLFLSASLFLFPQALSLCLSFSSKPSHSPLIACVVSPFLFSSCLVIYMSLLSPPCAALSSALTSKVLYVCSVNYEMKISAKQYKFSLEKNTIVKVHQRTGTFLHKKRRYLYMLSNSHFVQ